MQPEKRNISGGSIIRRSRKFELFFYEQVGNRSYLRFTRLALILIVCLTVIPAAAIFALFLTQRHAILENVNVSIRVAPGAPGNYAPVVQPPPMTMPTPPKPRRSPSGGESARAGSAVPSLNTNAPSTPTPTPKPPRPPG